MKLIMDVSGSMPSMYVFKLKVNLHNTGELFISEHKYSDAIKKILKLYYETTKNN